MAELILHLKRDDQKLSMAVDQSEFILGRLPECDWCIPDEGISRRHARLIKTASGVWTIEDMGSKNGTRLNDSLITSPQPFKHGDMIWLGPVGLQVVLQSSAKSQPDHTLFPTAGNTIFRDVRVLQQQWIQAERRGEADNHSDKANARLKDLVEIAKNLSAAASIETIFSRVQEVVFRYLKSIDRLALLVDVDGLGKLELLNVATRNVSQQQQLANNVDWISQTICQQVFSEKVAIQTADAQMDQRFEGQQSIWIKDIHSAIAVPLWDEDRVVGVLYADANFSASNWAEAGEEDLSFFSVLANLLAANVQRWLLTQKLKNEEAIRQRLERYHSPAVIQHLIAKGALSEGRLPPVEQEISILFADIVDFTALSERLSPERIARLLNALFEEMLQEVFAVSGTLDKYIGDCIMAFFGAPEPQPDHADRAFAAAIGMLDRLERLNASEVLGEPLQLRIAINSGKAVVGDVGSSQRFDYTALGATINLAARLEGVCPPGECVVGEATYNLLERSHNLKEMGEHRFKGIKRPVWVYQTQRH
jgi:adenylate cyclase